ncbi:hypothetical protein VCRA2119O145_90175 [Vibrio crassostreae]|nr:hypothetical protein VCRA2113O138_70038 [Vibrio crassostreae]CAK2276831.1 hypothetical protein VCRA2119O145_90175 [Vibrio crassostreae]CAK2277844.1 hypothetical protein VCRA2118O144_90174 [Vibrio crassostreae]CAK2388686.1 hypothetical protein VCRA2117O143_80014 [Vibrio crassostreae]CAK3153919.1 hypothetical protein VCRA2134O163_90014 [Vibrio crassostreae]
MNLTLEKTNIIRRLYNASLEPDNKINNNNIDCKTNFRLFILIKQDKIDKTKQYLPSFLELAKKPEIRFNSLLSKYLILCSVGIEITSKIGKSNKFTKLKKTPIETNIMDIKTDLYNES